ncbi:MAG TPA: YwiC-like family protein [Aggregatilineaceae bacterium]|nr:YwiC-like family protein [Aggregatilineaceae bacterium]
MTIPQTAVSRVRWKSIAIPPEHGSWGFLLEPILLGLLVAPSLAGVMMSLAVLGAFLMRHPLKIAFTDWRRGKRYARTKTAERFVVGFGALAAAGLFSAVALAGIDILLPVLLVVPLALLQLFSYVQNEGRNVLPELAGAGAIAISVSSIALAGGESQRTALLLWLVLLARNIPSILYIRARLRLDKGKPVEAIPTYLSNLVAVLGVTVLTLVAYTSILSLVALLILAARAVYGLSPYRRNIRVQVIGVLEMIYGLLVVILTALGYTL